MYNGSKSLGADGHRLYFIWFILHASEAKKLSGYWEATGLMDASEYAIKVLMVGHAIQGHLSQCKVLSKLKLKHLMDSRDLLLQFECPKMKILKNSDVCLLFLVQQGYLCFEETVSERCEIYKLRFPNELIKGEFRGVLEEY